MYSYSEITVTSATLSILKSMFLPFTSNLVVYGASVELSESASECMTPKNSSWLSSLTSTSLTSLLDLHTALKCPFLWHLWQTESLAGQFLLSCLYRWLSTSGTAMNMIKDWICGRWHWILRLLSSMSLTYGSTATYSVCWPLTVGCYFLTLSHWWAKSMAF